MYYKKLAQLAYAELKDVYAAWKRRNNEKSREERLSSALFANWSMPAPHFYG
jgi:hypothetical protein